MFDNEVKIQRANLIKQSIDKGLNFKETNDLIKAKFNGKGTTKETYGKLAGITPKKRLPKGAVVTTTATLQQGVPFHGLVANMIQHGGFTNVVLNGNGTEVTISAS